MILINKGKEPRKLMEFRQQLNAEYADMPKDVRSAILESLMKEQGFLCAYCMSRIPQEKKQPSVSIEHWDPQSLSSDDQAMNYRNMFAVCNGNRSCRGKKTCDAARGNKRLTVHPLKHETLSLIKYKTGGNIYSENSDINQDLNDTLNLNCPDSGLLENRLRALQTMLNKMKEKYPSGDITNYCTKLLQAYSGKFPKTPYVGILIYWLKKHLGKQSNRKYKK